MEITISTKKRSTNANDSNDYCCCNSYDFPVEMFSF